MRSEVVESLPEPIRIISDLHLGHEAGVVRNVSGLRPLFDGAGTVLFNGDTAEVRSRSGQGRAHDDMRELEALLEDLGVAKSVFLTGNHDPRISACHYLDLCQGKLLVTHGDFLFRYVSPWSKKLRHCRGRIDSVLAEADDDRLQRDFEYRLEVTRKCCDVLEIVRHRFKKTPWGLLQFFFRSFGRRRAW